MFIHFFFLYHINLNVLSAAQLHSWKLASTITVWSVGLWALQQVYLRVKCNVNVVPFSWNQLATSWIITQDLLEIKLNSRHILSILRTRVPFQKSLMSRLALVSRHSTSLGCTYMVIKLSHLVPASIIYELRSIEARCAMEVSRASVTHKNNNYSWSNKDESGS